MSDPIYQITGIKIDKSLAIFGNASYPIANIGAVSIEKIEAKNSNGWTLIFVLLGAWTMFSFGILGLLFFCLAALTYYFGRKPEEHRIILSTSSGNLQAYQSADFETVRNIKSAIEQAVSSR